MTDGEVPDIEVGPDASPAEMRAVCEWLYANITDGEDRQDLSEMALVLREILGDEHDFKLGVLPSEDEQRRIDDLFLGLMLGSACMLADMELHGCEQGEEAVQHLLKHAGQGVRWAGMCFYLMTEDERFWPSEFAHE